MTREVELKAVLSPEEFSRVNNHFAEAGKLVRDETVYTEKYYSADKTVDVRLRQTNGVWEVVQKSGKAADAVRLEHTHCTNLFDTDINTCRAKFRAQQLLLAPPWTTVRKDYVFTDGDEPFEASLQDIPNFARILEIEYKGESKHHDAVEAHIRCIMHALRVEPVRPEEFEAKIAAYKKS